MLDKISQKAIVVICICCAVIILSQWFLIYKMISYNIQANEILNTGYYELYDFSINRERSKNDMYLKYHFILKKLNEIKW